VGEEEPAAEGVMMREDPEALHPGQVVSYMTMCSVEGASLQRGMNFRLHGRHSVVLMSRRPNAPYNDRVEDDGETIIYEGHDAARGSVDAAPDQADQPLTLPSGKPTQNGLFMAAAKRTREAGDAPEPVRVYEKVRDGIWIYVGLFDLLDGWTESDGRRQVCKFRLRVNADAAARAHLRPADVGHNRMIPTAVKLQVWQRDQGRCRLCDSVDQLHFDHIIPYSKGGSSTTAENIQLLCARHNLEKRAHIQ
jgi:hypothetical protein